MPAKPSVVRTLIGAAGLLLALISPSLAKEITLPVPEVKQSLDVWCWVAVAEMLVRYYNGSAPRQCRLLELGYRVPDGTCCRDKSRCRRPGQLTEIASLIENFTGQKTHVTGAPPRPSSVAHELERNRAIVAAVRPPGQNVGHVVVVRGIRRTTTGVQLLLNDPMSRIPQTIDWSRLRSMWIGSIIVRFDGSSSPDFEDSDDDE